MQEELAPSAPAVRGRPVRRYMAHSEVLRAKSEWALLHGALNGGTGRTGPVHSRACWANRGQELKSRNSDTCSDRLIPGPTLTRECSLILGCQPSSSLRDIFLGMEDFEMRRTER